MSNKVLSFIWGGFYVLCLAMSFFGDTQGTQYGALMVLGLAFFVPGGFLLHRGVTKENGVIVRTVFWLSVSSLVSTMIMLIVTFLTVNASKDVGLAVHILLAAVSVPMICSQVWVLSLFIWACFLMVCISYMRKHRKK